MTTFRIQLENLIGEFNFFKKEFTKKMDTVQVELNMSKVNKNNIESNFKNIITTFGDRIIAMTKSIENIKSDCVQLKSPLIE